MNLKLIKKWFFRVVIAQIVFSIAAFIWMDYEIDAMWGEHTGVVDHSKFNVSQALIAIQNINALSPDGRSMLANQTVIIDQGKIKSISTDSNVPTNALVIDGTGKYLIPGLIDSHVHLWQSPNDLLLYLANGVTHIRELNGSPDHLRWRAEVEQGRIGPKLFVASSRLNSSGVLKGWFDNWTAKITNLSAPKNANKVLQAFKEREYNAVKIYSFLSKEGFWAINAAAEKLNIPLLGHIPVSVGLDDIWNSNLSELAHIEEIIKALDREFGSYNSQNAQEFIAFVNDRSDEISRQLANNKMAVVTTLWLMESFAKQRHDIDAALSEVELAYVNPGITELSPLSSRVMGWLPNSNIYRISNDATSQQRQRDKIYWNTYAQAHQILLRAMTKQGVIILAGTDANVPTVVPGFSMHDELRSLTKAGMSPAQALLSATAAPASWMNVKSGKVAQGYNAELLILDANPLEKIEHTKTINSVISNGRLLTRPQLDQMLSDVKDANDQSRTADIDEYRK